MLTIGLHIVILVVHLTVVLDLVGALEFVVAVEVIVHVVGRIVDLHINLHQIRHLVGLVGYDIEEIAIGFVNAGHYLSESARIKGLYLLLLLSGEVVVTGNKSFFRVILCHNYRNFLQV